MSRTLRVFSSLSIGLFLSALAAAADDTAAQEKLASETPKYVLRYSFRPNETIRWRVVHQALVRTTVSGTTQTAETRSESVKLWQVKEVDETAGQATFVHSVESVDMRQSVSGRQDVHYNSETDTLIPAEFEDVAKAVDVPLSTIVLDNRGHVVKRHEERAQPGASTGEMTIPLPEKSVAINDVWSFPHDTSVRQKDGSTKQVKTRQDFTLMSVDNGIATIKVETIVLTPIRDPALEAQLIQHVIDGTVRFDIAAGRVVGQQTDIDKRVIGFQGEASSLHYVTRFTEELLPEGKPAARVAAAAPKPKADQADESKPAAEGTESAAKESGAAEAPAGEVTKKPEPPANPDKKKPAVATAPAKKTSPSGRPAAPARPGNKSTTKAPAKKPAPKAAAKQNGTAKTKTGSRQPATNDPQRR
ncbi:MAG TPA: hypothetical protein VHD36_05260 [Pirellulales bacterium]|nr:hypothetical protein [Pirellulales bacterium]